MFKNLKTKVSAAVITPVVLGSSNANAALDSTSLDGIKSAILADIGVVTGVAIAILAVALSWDVAFGLAKKYIKKGAS